MFKNLDKIYSFGYGCGLFRNDTKGIYGRDGYGYGESRYKLDGEDYGHGCGFLTFCDDFDGYGYGDRWD